MTAPADTTAAPLISRGAVAAYVVLAFLAFVPAFLPGQQIAGSDYVTGGYYFLEFAIERMNGGHLPKWVPYVFGGVPMYANPGGLFYPTRLLFSEILPIERVMPAVYVVQFALAGIGMHLFARTLGARPWVAFVAGIMFQFTGVTYSYVYAGHDGRIIGATLTPFLFYFLTRAVRTGKARWFIGMSATIGFVLLSFQLQSLYYLLLGGAAWAIYLLVRTRHEASLPRLVGRAAMGLSAVAFAFVLAAVNLLPFAGYVDDSPRSAQANRDYAFSTQFSMPVSETAGFAVPEQDGVLEKYTGANPFKLHTEYVGALVLLLLVVGALGFRSHPDWRFMAALAVVMLTISYGSSTPLYAIYYKVLPGTASFRSPSIALFMVSFALVTMAALTLEMLARGVDARADGSKGATPLPRRLSTTFTVLLALGATTLVIALGTAINGGDSAIGWARFSTFFLALLFIIRRWTLVGLRTRVVATLLAVLTIVDLWIIDHDFLWTQPPPEIAFAEDDVVRFLKTQPKGRVWVYPFAAQRGTRPYQGNGRFGPQSDYLMRFGIATAGGEHGNQLYRWNRLAGIAASGAVDWKNFLQYPAMLNAAGIRYVVTGVPLRLNNPEGKQGIPGLREVFRGKAGVVYENVHHAPRATLVSTVKPVASPEALVATMRTGAWDARTSALIEGAPPPALAALVTDRVVPPSGSAEITSEDPDRLVITVRAERPSFLVVTENFAEGWVASVDGVETPIIRTNLTLRGLLVSAGNHEVVMEFTPAPLRTGLLISGAAWLVLIAAVGAVSVSDKYSRSHAISQ